MKIIIEPNDVLMFRESKPYTAGESHLARSTLPLPQVVAGALRTAILVKGNFSDKACKLAGVIKEEGKLIPKEPEFEVLGHFLLYKPSKDEKEQEYFPTPFDVAKAKGIDGYFFVEPLPLDGSSERWRGKFVFKGKTIHFGGVGGYLSYDDLIRYLKGELREDELEDAIRGDLVKKESRVGIKLGNAKTTEEGYFYKAEFLRFSKGVKLSVWLNGNDIKDSLGESGLIRLGGESRFARFTIIDENPLKDLKVAWNEIKEKINEKGRFKLYVATPLLIRSGDNYTWDVKPILEEKLKKKIKIKNIYSLIGKPLTFSGWDYANNRPKPNRHAVPAGSVYFVEFDDNFELDKPYLKLGELTKLGYGLCFMGVW